MSQLWSTLTFFARLIEKQIMQHGEVNHPISTPPLCLASSTTTVKSSCKSLLVVLEFGLIGWRMGMIISKISHKKQAKHMPNEGSRNSNDRISNSNDSGNLQVYNAWKKHWRKHLFFTGLVYDQPVWKRNKGCPVACALQTELVAQCPSTSTTINHKPEFKKHRGFPINEMVCNQMRTIPTHVLYRILN